MNKISNYFKGVGQEARRVRWPSRQKLWKAVGTVCVITIVSSLAIFFLDWMVAQVIKGFSEAFPAPSSNGSSSGTGGNSITPAIRIIIGLLFK
jgi:preprotein translocase SecE subunit